MQLECRCPLSGDLQEEMIITSSCELMDFQATSARSGTLQKTNLHQDDFDLLLREGAADPLGLPCDNNLSEGLGSSPDVIVGRPTNSASHADDESIPSRGHATPTARPDELDALLDAVAADVSCPYLRQISIPNLLSASSPPTAAPGAAPLISPLPYSQPRLAHSPHQPQYGLPYCWAQYSGADYDGGQPSAVQSSASNSGRGGAASSYDGYTGGPAAGGACMLSNPASPNVSDSSRRPIASTSLPGQPASTLGGSFSDAQCPHVGTQLTLNGEHRAPWLMASFRRIAAAVRARGDSDKGAAITLAAARLPAQSPLQGAVAPWKVGVGQGMEAAC